MDNPVGTIAFNEAQVLELLFDRTNSDLSSDLLAKSSEEITLFEGTQEPLTSLNPKLVVLTFYRYLSILVLYWY